MGDSTFNFCITDWSYWEMPLPWIINEKWRHVFPLSACVSLVGWDVQNDADVLLHEAGYSPKGPGGGLCSQRS